MFRTLLLAALLGVFSSQTGAAGEGGFSADSAAKVSILPGWRTASGTHMAALRIQLAPGWKTYWRAPGEGGIPPRFDWTGSRNIAGAAFHWPVPKVFSVNGMRSIGYAGELVLPVELTPAAPGQAIALRAEVALGVCQDVCVPMHVRVSADLGTGGRPDPRIRAAIAARPFSEAEAGLGPVRCAVEPIRDGVRVTATLPMPPLGPAEHAVFEHPNPRVWVAEAATRRHGGALTAVTEMVAPTNRPFAIDRSQLRITVLAGGEAVEVRGCTG